MDVCEANTWLSPLTPHIHAAQHTHVHTTVIIYTYHCADVPPEVRCLAELLVAHRALVVPLLIVLLREGNTTTHIEHKANQLDV
jgi:hypothetical protein